MNHTIKTFIFYPCMLSYLVFYVGASINYVTRFFPDFFNTPPRFRRQNCKNPITNYMCRWKFTDPSPIISFRNLWKLPFYILSIYLNSHHSYLQIIKYYMFKQEYKWNIYVEKLQQLSYHDVDENLCAKWFYKLIWRNDRG